MFVKNKTIPILLIVIGILGPIFYSVIERTTHITALSEDALKGIVYGIFIGIELLGIYFLAKNRKIK